MVATEEHFRLWHRALCTDLYDRQGSQANEGTSTEKKDKYWKEQVLLHLGQVLDPGGFAEWWERARDFLEETEPFAAQIIHDQEQFESYGFFDDELGLNECLIHVNLDLPFSVLMPCIEQVLREHQAKSAGRPKSRERFAEYPLCRTPNIFLITTLFDIYKSYVDGMSLVAIAEKYELVPQSKTDDFDHKIVMEKAANRWIKQAKRLIQNASYGIFPEHLADVVPDDGYHIVLRAVDGSAINPATGAAFQPDDYETADISNSN